jgi:hypothetical protein
MNTKLSGYRPLNSLIEHEAAQNLKLQKNTPGGRIVEYEQLCTFHYIKPIE